MDCKLYIITPSHLLKPARASIYVCGFQLKVSSWTTIWTVTIIYYTGRKCTLKLQESGMFIFYTSYFLKLFFAVRTVALFSQNVILILKNDNLNNKWGGGRNHFMVYSCFLVKEIVKVHWKGIPGNLLMKSEKQTRAGNLKDHLKKI